MTAPAVVRFELTPDGSGWAAADQAGEEPKQLVELGYDVVFPLTVVPMGELRKKCWKWRRDRDYRILGILPFLLPNSDYWKHKSSQCYAVLGVKHILALFPKFELWRKHFNEWTSEDGRHCGLTALWKIDTGEITWAEGLRSLDHMRTRGIPTRDFKNFAAVLEMS